MHNLTLEEVYLLIGELYVLKAVDKMRADKAEARVKELENELAKPADHDPIRHLPSRGEVTGR
jgi:hypothetical protein